MISYYDLLKLVKEGKAPKKIKVQISLTMPKIYIVEYDMGNFNYYRLKNEKEENETYDYYLSSCFLESMMFDKCIEILDEVFEHLEEITYKPRKVQNTINALIKNQKKILEKIKELEK
jgi:hypothetical protein